MNVYAFAAQGSAAVTLGIAIPAAHFRHDESRRACGSTATRGREIPPTGERFGRRSARSFFAAHSSLWDEP
jgi:hypothetical protein